MVRGLADGSIALLFLGVDMSDDFLEMRAKIGAYCSLVHGL